MLTYSLALFAAQALVVAAGSGAAQAAKPWPVQLREDLVRIAGVEWRLQVSAREQCTRTASAAGLAVDYIGAYEQADRAYVRATTGLGSLPQVVAVMPGSPAARAGFVRGDEIVALGDKSVTEFANMAEDPDLLAEDIRDWIAAHEPGRTISIRVRRKGKLHALQVRPQRACAARFFLETDESLEANSDGSNVAVTTGILRFTRNDDELALIAGHELAHVIAHKGSRAGLFGRRRMEDEADLLGAGLAHCAGFDVPRAIAFWNRFAKHETFGSPRIATHRSAATREKRLRAAAPGLACPAIR